MLPQTIFHSKTRRAFRELSKRLLVFSMVFVYTIQAVDARLVSLDVQHDPSTSQFWKNRPYFVDARKKIEAEWQKLDPQVSRTVRIPFVINTDGSLSDIPGAIDPNQFQYVEIVAMLQAAKAIQAAEPFQPLPQGQQTVTVIGVFKSKTPREPVAPIDKQKILDGLLLLGLGALAGFGIYALANSIGNNQSQYYETGGRGCSGSPSCSACHNCSSCKWCNSGGSPCGVWYRSR